MLLDGTFGRLPVEKTPTTKSLRALKVKSQFLVLMNYVPLIDGVHLYL